jgi:hypothetical protein
VFVVVDGFNERSKIKVTKNVEKIFKSLIINVKKVNKVAKCNLIMEQ